MKKLLLIATLSLASVQVFAANNCVSAVGQSNSCCSAQLITSRLANLGDICNGGTASATSCTSTSMSVGCSNGMVQNFNYPNKIIRKSLKKSAF